MSMKRSRQKSYGSRRDSGDVPSLTLGKTAASPEKTWEEYTANQPDDAFVAYSMKSRYEKDALVMHSKFGKGVVTAVEPSRIEVLFADGKKKLGHGLS